MAKRKTDLGLGRGLNALLGDPELPTQGEGSISLPISQVEPGLNQPRKRFDPETLSDLAESIRVHGIIQPLTVRRLASGYYQIIAGERRWRAAKQAGLTEVPAVIIEADDRKVMELGLIENLQREDLNPAEEARGYQVLMEEYGLTQEQVAEEMGWFWQIDEAYVLGKYSLCRSLIDQMGEELVSALPTEAVTDNGRFSPADRYQEIYDAVY